MDPQVTPQQPEQATEQPASGGPELQRSRGRTALRRQEQARRRGELQRALQALPPGNQALC